jgi:hypothetical protein
MGSNRRGPGRAGYCAVALAVLLLGVAASPAAAQHRPPSRWHATAVPAGSAVVSRGAGDAWAARQTWEAGEPSAAGVGSGLAPRAAREAGQAWETWQAREAPTGEVGSGMAAGAVLKDAAMYTLLIGAMTLGLGSYGYALGGAVGAVRETPCFGPAGAAADIGWAGGVAVGLTLSTAGIAAILTGRALRGSKPEPEPEPEPQPEPEREPQPDYSIGQYLASYAVMGTVVGAAIGAAAGALEAGENPACGSRRSAAGRGALQFGAAGLITSPVWLVLPGGM